MIHFRSSGNDNILVPADLLLKASRDMGLDFDLWCEDSYMSGKPHWAFDNYRCGGAIGYDASHLFYTQPGWGMFFEQKMGRGKTKLLTYAIDEDTYPLVTAEKIYDVGFIGNVMAGDGRQEYLDIIKANFNCLVTSEVATRDITKELAKCKVCFNHIRYEEVNIRFFEALASGAQVVSYSPALHLFAEEGKHYLSFRTPEEAIEKINYLLKHDKIREKIVKDARSHVLKYHTYKNRVQEILNFI